jgi:hypothetical protein
MTYQEPALRTAQELTTEIRTATCLNELKRMVGCSTEQSGADTRNSIERMDAIACRGDNSQFRLDYYWSKIDSREYYWANDEQDA